MYYSTLQRLPKVIGNQSLVRELAYTARKLSSSEALQHGLVSKVFKDKAECVKAGIEMVCYIQQIYYLQMCLVTY